MNVTNINLSRIINTCFFRTATLGKILISSILLVLTGTGLKIMKCKKKGGRNRLQSKLMIVRQNIQKSKEGSKRQKMQSQHSQEADTWKHPWIKQQGDGTIHTQRIDWGPGHWWGLRKLKTGWSWTIFQGAAERWSFSFCLFYFLSPSSSSVAPTLSLHQSLWSFSQAAWR